MDKDTAILLTQSKSTGIAILLTLLFGGLGMLYVGIASGMVMVIAEIILFIITIATFGFGVMLLIPFHIICVIWAIIAVKAHNNKLISKMS